MQLKPHLRSHSLFPSWRQDSMDKSYHFQQQQKVRRYHSSSEPYLPISSSPRRDGYSLGSIKPLHLVVNCSSASFIYIDPLTTFLLVLNLENITLQSLNPDVAPESIPSFSLLFYLVSSGGSLDFMDQSDDGLRDDPYQYDIGLYQGGGRLEYEHSIPCSFILSVVLGLSTKPNPSMQELEETLKMMRDNKREIWVLKDTKIKLFKE